MTDLSVIILSWNTRDLLEACLRSLEDSVQDVDFETVVVDNASEDGSLDLVTDRFPGVRLIVNAKNEGYARGNNIGIRAAKGDYLLLLNSDTEVEDHALDRMVGFLAENPDYGACGAQLFYPDGRVQRACMRFPTLATTLFFDTFIERLWPGNPVVRRYFMREFDHRSSIDVDQPPGACCMAPRSVVDLVGLLDEELWLFYNDVDWCLRIRRAGYKIRFLTEAQVVHHGGGSTRKYADFSLEWHRNRVRYFRKHFGLAGTWATRFAALIKAGEEVIRFLRAGRGFRSPEVRRILSILKEVLKT